MLNTGLIALVDIKTQAIAKTIRVQNVDVFSSHDVVWGRDGKTVTFAGHGGLQSYEVVEGTHVHTVATIICPAHGYFRHRMENTESRPDMEQKATSSMSWT